MPSWQGKVESTFFTFMPIRMACSRLPCRSADLVAFGAYRVRDWKIDSSDGVHAARLGVSASSESDPLKFTEKSAARGA